MRRGGRILIFLVLIIVILIAVAFLVIGRGLFTTTPQEEVLPTPQMVSIISVGQPINRDDLIKPEALATMLIPPDAYNEKMITNPGELEDKYAAYPLVQGMPIIREMVSDRPGANQVGSEAARIIQPGLVAVTLPLNWQSGVAYAIKAGDRVNVIATTLFVDVDSSWQSILPNNFGQVVNVGAPPEASPLIVLGMNNGDGARTGGRAELDPVLNQAIYFIPSEAQRPRLVSQQILQDIQVLGVGLFPLGDSAAVPTPAAPDQELPPGQQAAPATPVVARAPEVITLIVSPQDAVALTYLLYGGAKFTFTLRAPDDSSRGETEAATLQYILSQYAIPVPAKLPYAIEPRVDELKSPSLSSTPTPSP
jgi:pilus assembly protein CpaB